MDRIISWKKSRSSKFLEVPIRLLFQSLPPFFGIKKLAANAPSFWQDVLLLPLPKYLQFDLIINAIINVVMLVVWKYLKHFYVFMLFLKIFARKLLNTANCKIIPLPLPCFTCLNFYVNLKNRFSNSYTQRKKKL